MYKRARLSDVFFLKKIGATEACRQQPYVAAHPPLTFGGDFSEDGKNLQVDATRRADFDGMFKMRSRLH